MASGAIGPADPMAPSPMEATPVTRRSSAEARREATSPVAKKAARREKVEQVNMPPTELTHAQLVQEVHRMHLQDVKDADFFENTVDQINDHADCLWQVRGAIKQLRKEFDSVTQRVSNAEVIVSDNDHTL
jgi:hypothetical protein